MIKISVLMSAYKEDDGFLKKSIESLLTQSFREFELILVDDGMTESNRKIIEAFDDERLKLITNEKNIGLTRSLNKAAKMAQGKYLVRLDSDDWCHVDRLSEQFSFMENNNDIVLSGTNYLEYDSAGNEVSKKNAFIIGDDSLKKSLPICNPFTHSSLIFKNAIFDKINGYDESFYCAQDYDLVYRMSLLGKIENLEKKLVFRTLGENKISFRMNKKQVFNSLKVRAQAVFVYGVSISFFKAFIKSLIVLILPQKTTTFLRKFF